MVGLPYASTQSVELQEKMSYLDHQYAVCTAAHCFVCVNYAGVRMCVQVLLIEIELSSDVQQLTYWSQ